MVQGFQITVADQRATQTLLQKALDVLKGFYDKKALLQTGQPAGPPPPGGFKEYKKSGAAGGVMGMIQQIIEDAQAMEAEAIKDETAMQEAYQGLVRETNNSIKEKVVEIDNKTKDRGNAEVARAEAQQAHEDVLGDLE